MNIIVTAVAVALLHMPQEIARITVRGLTVHAMDRVILGH